MFLGFAGQPPPDGIEPLRALFARTDPAARDAGRESPVHCAAPGASGGSFGCLWSGPCLGASWGPGGFAVLEGLAGSGATAGCLSDLRRERGPAFEDSLPGECAGALWDGRGGKLLLARDRLGAVPLYHRRVGGALYFSNRLEPLVRLPGPRPTPSAQALDYYLTFLHPPSGWSWFEDIGKLTPGQRRLWSSGGWEEVSPRPEEEEAFRGSLEEAVLAVRDRLEASVGRAVERGGKLGLFFSGGLDSAALLRVLRTKAQGPPLTFTAAAEGNPDLEFARRLAEAEGAENVRIVLRPEELAETWDGVIAAMDEPMGNPSALAAHQVARAASGRVDTLVSGIGSDEVFAGHLKHVAAGWALTLQRWPSAGKALGLVLGRSDRAAGLERFFRSLRSGGSPLEAYRALYHHLEESRRRALLSRRCREALADEESAGRRKAEEVSRVFRDRESFLCQVTRVDWETWLLEDLIPTLTAAIRPTGLAAALPFCDRALVDLALRLPFRWKVRGLKGKRVLRRAVAPWVPETVLRRGRQGFTQPIGRWLRGAWKVPAGKRLWEHAEGSGTLDPEAVRSIWEEHQSGRDRSSVLWALVVLSGWCAGYSGVAG